MNSFKRGCSLFCVVLGLLLGGVTCLGAAEPLVVSVVVTAPVYVVAGKPMPSIPVVTERLPASEGLAGMPPGVQMHLMPRAFTLAGNPRAFFSSGLVLDAHVGGESVAFVLFDGGDRREGLRLMVDNDPRRPGRFMIPVGARARLVLEPQRTHNEDAVRSVDFDGGRIPRHETRVLVQWDGSPWMALEIADDGELTVLRVKEEHVRLERRSQGNIHAPHSTREPFVGLECQAQMEGPGLVSFSVTRRALAQTRSPGAEGFPFVSESRFSGVLDPSRRGGDIETRLDGRLLSIRCETTRR